MTPGSLEDYVIRVHPGVAAISAHEWDEMLSSQGEPTPFLKHAYLAALETSGSACSSTGWEPMVLECSTAGELQALCLVYSKTHSYGEYVFDWSWAQAWERSGRPYYPKLLCAVPFTPVQGTRLMAASPQAREALARALTVMTAKAGLSTAHALFLNAVDRNALSEQGWLLRRGVQFHWSQRTVEPWVNFEDFLASMQGTKRKKILQERRRVRDAGVSFLVLEGKSIEEVHWDYFYRCYVGTYQAHLSQPYLTRKFFHSMAQDMAEHWLMFIAEKDGAWVGASLIAIDPATGRAWGRYWGCTEDVDCLHFEACYYQPLQWCIKNAYTRFEGGAQGAHKMARGLMPTETWSAHWCPQPGFRSALAEFLAQERDSMADYKTELLDHSPFKTAIAAS